ncbi:hypothetical protein ILYODFUR_023225 [Ilyodon furcidens]|uniref:Uncharacterized protein n=1 Tax=Ilyodon furcidens TaxID=33524 RepID=A0ABV0V5G8_9TELE
MFSKHKKRTVSMNAPTFKILAIAGFKKTAFYALHVFVSGYRTQSVISTGSSIVGRGEAGAYLQQSMGGSPSQGNTDTHRHTPDKTTTHSTSTHSLIHTNTEHNIH